MEKSVTQEISANVTQGDSTYVVSYDTTLSNPIPKIEFVNMEPKRVRSFYDPFSIWIRYEDGDGDVGFLEKDSLSVEITDARGPIEQFHLPPLIPMDTNLSIKGMIKLTVTQTALLKEVPQEQTQFSLRLRDRKGNWSDVVHSDSLLILSSSCEYYEVTFDQVYTTLQNKCTPCHIPGNEDFERKESPFDSYENIQPWGEEILKLVETREMPRGDTTKPLTPEEFQAIRCWVEGGKLP